MSAPGFWSPAWQSRPSGHRHLRPFRFLAVGVLTLLLPALSFFLLSVPFGILTEDAPNVFETGVSGAALSILATVMLLTIFAPIYGIVLVPLAMVCLIIAMRFGRAGWGVAGLAALGVALILGQAFGGAAGDGAAPIFAGIMVPIVLMHALVLWGATRILLPETLLPPRE